MNSPTYSESLCIFNDEWLFSIGGFGPDHIVSTKIERLNIGKGFSLSVGAIQNGDAPLSWELLNVQTPYGVSSPGVF